MRTLILFAMIATLGFGCAPVRAPQPPVEEAPTFVNEGNCVASGGASTAEGCDCPAGYAPDPAGFCLDGAGKPGLSVKATS